MKLIVALLITTILSGCASAKLVEKSFEPKGGVVKYPQNSFAASDNLEEAKKLMADFCAPEPVKVTKERIAEETVSFTKTSGNSLSADKDNFTYITFRCVSKNTKSNATDLDL